MEKHNWQKVVLQSAQQQPQARWGHAFTTIADSLVFFAGYANAQYMNDLWEFNTLTLEWIQHQTCGEIPASRSNCTMHYDAQHNNIIIFGGGGPNKKRFNNVSILDWSTKEWKEIAAESSEKSPWQRTYHSSQLIYPYLIIFAGQSHSDLNDLWTFHLETKEWQEITLTNPPPARRFHTSALINQQLYIIAGCYDKYRCHNDVFQIDFSPYLTTGNPEGMEWKELKLKNNSFLARWGHTSAVFNSKIYIFGGRFSNDLQDIIMIDPLKQISKNLKVSGELPKARRRHSCLFVGSCMTIFGGFNGQYFNDIFFINVLDTKVKGQNVGNNQEQVLIRMINSPEMSDSRLQTNDGEDFFVHRGLISDRFVKKQDMQQFLEELNNKYSELQLRQVFEILYTGVGNLNQLIPSTKCQFHLFETSLEKQTHLKREILPESQVDCIFSTSQLNNSPIIMVEEQAYNKLVSASRYEKYYDLMIIFNGEFCIPVNRALLAVNSSYFSYLLKNHQQKQLQITLEKDLGDVRVFQVLINFIQTGWVIIPKAVDWRCWVYIHQLAEYFCLERLIRICQQELTKQITVENYHELFSIAIELNLKMLLSYCSQFNFDQLVLNKQFDYLKSLRKDSTNKKEEIICNMYELQKFSLKQLQLRKTPKICDCPWKKGTQSGQVKQNAQNILQ